MPYNNNYNRNRNNYNNNNNRRYNGANNRYNTNRPTGGYDIKATFENRIDAINKRVHDLGFKDVYNWAKTAAYIHEITDSQMEQVVNLVAMRNIKSHGHSGEVKPNINSCKAAGYYLGIVKKSKAHPSHSTTYHKPSTATKYHAPTQPKPVQYTTSGGEIARGAVLENNVRKQCSVDGSKMHKLMSYLIAKVKKWTKETKLQTIELAGMENRVPLLCSTSRLNSLAAQALIVRMTDEERDDLMRKI